MKSPTGRCVLEGEEKFGEKGVCGEISFHTVRHKNGGKTMKKTLKKSLAIVLSLMMIISVFSVGAAVSADTEYTMIAIVAMKPAEDAAQLSTRHIFNLTEADLTALNGGTPVDLGSYGFEAEWGIGDAASNNPAEYPAGNWGNSHWGYDANGNLYYETNFDITAGGNTPAEKYAAAGRGELKGILRETADGAPVDGKVVDALGRAVAPDMKANETLEGRDTIRLTLTTEEVYYAPAVTTKEIQLTNADSADGWWVYGNEEFSVDNEIKSEGTGSIKYPHTGGVAWGATFEPKDVTGIKSISFDIAANNDGILTEPTDKCFLLMSDGVLQGFKEPFNGEAFLTNDPESMKKVMQFDVSVFNTNKDEYTLTPDSKTFKTVTLTPSVVGEEFNYKNVTNFMHWSCTGYGGDHTEWMDNVRVTVEVAGEEPKEYVNFKTWGTDEFNAAVSSDTAEPGDNITTGANGVYTVYSRPATYGTSAAGVVGYASYGNTFMAYKNREYVYEFDFWVNDIAEDEKGEVLFYGDLYNQDTVDDATVNTYFTNGITYNDFAAEKTVRYNEEFGYAYKTLSATLVAEEDGNSESRWYYNRLNVRNQGERDSYAVGDVNFYECRIYDYTVDPFTPIVTLKPGEDQMAGFSNETNPNTANPREMDVLSVTKGALVSLPKAKNCDNTLLFGNAAADLKAGSYVIKYELSDIVVAGEGTLATVKIMNGANEVASKDITAADLNLAAKTNIIEVPFDVAADGKYSAELYINNKMGFSLKSIAMGVEIDPDDIAKVAEKINAIGEIQYDPDKELDNGVLITDARKAYDDLCQKYNGMDMSGYIDNFTMLTSAESLYAGKVAEYAEMLETAKIVDDSIASIPLPVTLESGEYIVAAEQALAEFVKNYSREKADAHITKENDLKLAREAYDLLLQVKYGDVDANGTVEATDALWALQAYVGSRQLDDTQFKAADVNLDEKVDTSDALAILQFAVQLRTELPVKN